MKGRHYGIEIAGSEDEDRDLAILEGNVPSHFLVLNSDEVVT